MFYNFKGDIYILNAQRMLEITQQNIEHNVFFNKLESIKIRKEVLGCSDLADFEDLVQVGLRFSLHCPGPSG